MEEIKKELNRLLWHLQVEYMLLWGIVALLVGLYETDWLPQGVLVGDGQADYAMQVAGILMAVGLIPFSLRMFSLSLTRYVRNLPLPEALKSYRRWSEVRLALLLAPALFNFSAYYCTLNTTGLLCGGMVLVASLFCVPGRGRLLAELNLNELEG